MEERVLVRKIDGRTDRNNEQVRFELLIVLRQPNALRFDAKYWRENTDKLTERFNKFVAQ